MIRPDGYLVHNGAWSQGEPILSSSYGGSNEQVVVAATATASSAAVSQQLDTTASPALISDTVIEQAKKTDLCFEDEMEDVDRWTAELDEAANRVEEEKRLKIESEEAARFEEDNKAAEEALQALECFAKDEKHNAEEAQQVMEQFLSSNKTDDTMEAIEDEDSFCKMLADKLQVRECFAKEEKHKAEEIQQATEQFLSSNKTDDTTNNEKAGGFASADENEEEEHEDPDEQPESNGTADTGTTNPDIDRNIEDKPTSTLPVGWEDVLDTATGEILYYQNIVTNTVSFSLPVCEEDVVHNDEGVNINNSSEDKLCVDDNVSSSKHDTIILGMMGRLMEDPESQNFSKMLADKLQVLDCSAEEAQQVMNPFCRLCSDPHSDVSIHHPWCTHNPNRDKERCDVLLNRMKHGFTTLGCDACSFEYFSGRRIITTSKNKKKQNSTTINAIGRHSEVRHNEACIFYQKQLTKKRKARTRKLKQPILNLVTGELLSTVMCSQFLLPEDIASLLQIDEIFDSHEQLRSSYCRLHGTKFDDTYEDTAERRHRNCRNDTSSSTTNHDNDGNYCGNNNNNKNDDDDGGNDDDVSFLVHALEQQKFILADPTSVSSLRTTTVDDDDKTSIDKNQKPPSLSPDCLDCRMARFFSKKKCPCCSIFFHHKCFDDSQACEGKCKKVICEDCGGNSCDEKDCDDTGIQCEKCFDGFYCEHCDAQFHNKCVQSDECTECGTKYCRHCVAPGYR